MFCLKQLYYLLMHKQIKNIGYILVIYTDKLISGGFKTMLKPPETEYVITVAHAKGFTLLSSKLIVMFLKLM